MPGTSPSQCPGSAAALGATLIVAPAIAMAPSASRIIFRPVRESPVTCTKHIQCGPGDKAQAHPRPAGHDRGAFGPLPARGEWVGEHVAIWLEDLAWTLPKCGLPMVYLAQDDN